MSGWHKIATYTYEREERLGDYVERPIHMAVRKLPRMIEIAWLTDRQMETDHEAEAAPMPSIRLARVGEFDLGEQIDMILRLATHRGELKTMLAGIGDGSGTRSE